MAWSSRARRKPDGTPEAFPALRGVATIYVDSNGEELLMGKRRTKKRRGTY